MIGILSVGGHVPRYRLSGKALGAVRGGLAVIFTSAAPPISDPTDS